MSFISLSMSRCTLQAQAAHLPQIIAAVAGGAILSLVGSVQSNMMIVAGVLLVLGACSVGMIKDNK